MLQGLRTAYTRQHDGSPVGYGLINNKQYGFIAGRSISLQLLHMLDTEYLEYGGQIDVMYSDFEKAFDKVPHARLLSKLYSYGISNTVIKINGFKIF